MHQDAVFASRNHKTASKWWLSFYYKPSSQAFFSPTNHVCTLNFQFLVGLKLLPKPKAFCWTESSSEFRTLSPLCWSLIQYWKHLEESKRGDTAWKGLFCSGDGKKKSFESTFKRRVRWFWCKQTAYWENRHQPRTTLCCHSNGHSVTLMVWLFWNLYHQVEDRVPVCACTHGYVSLKAARRGRISGAHQHPLPR